MCLILMLLVKVISGERGIRTPGPPKGGRRISSAVQSTGLCHLSKKRL